jgi:hypothetical protein
MQNIEVFHGMLGGKNGGVNVVSTVANAAYDYIIVESGVTLSVFEDSAGGNLLTGKNLTGVAFTADRILSAGTGLTIKKLTFAGGLVWGYTLEKSKNLK